MTTEELNNGLDGVKSSPADGGIVEMIVIRPDVDEREVLDVCVLSAAGGLRGDRWEATCKKRLDDGRPNPIVQVTLMNSRAAQLLSGARERWPLAGDNLFVDLDLSDANLQAGQRLSVGSVVLEITAEPHNGCSKFAKRFGPDALKFVNSPEGKSIHLRGIYAKVVQDGQVRVGDRLEKV